MSLESLLAEIAILDHLLSDLPIAWDEIDLRLSDGTILRIAANFAEQDSGSLRSADATANF